MAKVLIKGLGGSCVRGAANKFYEYCRAKGYSVTGPFISHSTVLIDGASGSVPSLFGNSIKSYIAEVNVAISGAERVSGYEFPKNLSVKISN